MTFAKWKLCTEIMKANLEIGSPKLYGAPDFDFLVSMRSRERERDIDVVCEFLNNFTNCQFALKPMIYQFESTVYSIFGRKIGNAMKSL